MTPTIGEDERLREILLAAKRATPVDRLSHLAPVMGALQDPLAYNREARMLWHELLATLRQQPYYSQDFSMGAEPIRKQWIVAKPIRFDAVVSKIREMFPEQRK